MNLRTTSIWILLSVAVCAQQAGTPDKSKPGQAQHKPLAIATKPLANSLFYYPTHDEPATPAKWGFHYKNVDFDSSDGTKLHGWLIKNKGDKAKGIVVFSHGNAGSMGYHLGFVLWLANAGYQVLTFDYRGYGKSAGKVDREGMVEDVRAAIRFASKNGSCKHEPVICYGHSLGGAKLIAAVAGHKFPDLEAVITDAAFASYREMALIVGGRLAASLVSDELAPVKLIPKISPIPLLMIHGRKDPVVPFSQGMKLFKAAEQPKTLFEVRDGSHGDSLVLNHGAYRKRMLTWLDAQLKD